MYPQLSNPVSQLSPHSQPPGCKHNKKNNEASSPARVRMLITTALLQQCESTRHEAVTQAPPVLSC